MLLSAAIIVKDDTEHLDACLTSLRGLVDQVVVVEVGSCVGSVALAEQHGALVVREPWQDDLAAPRNRALDLATGEWILALDADERVGGDLDAVRELLADDDGSVGFCVRCVPRAGWTPVRQHRVWRNRVDIRFVGHALETVVPAIGAAAAARELRVEPLDLLTVHHLGGDRDYPATRPRLERMLLTELVRRPDRARVYDDLALLYEAAGDSERAVETWKRGIAVARVRNFSDPDDRLLHLDLVHHLLARELIDVDLEVLVEEARAAYVRTPTFELAAARLAFATGRPRDALEPLEWLVDLDDDEIIATGASYDERVFGEWSWGLIGLCRFALGDDGAAADAFRRAERFAPGDASYVVRRRLAEARAGSSA